MFRRLWPGEGGPRGGAEPRCLAAASGSGRTPPEGFGSCPSAARIADSAPPAVRSLCRWPKPQAGAESGGLCVSPTTTTGPDGLTPFHTLALRHTLILAPGLTCRSKIRVPNVGRVLLT